MLPSAAGTDRWQAATAATRPAVTATITAIQPVLSTGNDAKASPCTTITTTTAATPNGPADPSRITCRARCGGP